MTMFRKTWRQLPHYRTFIIRNPNQPGGGGGQDSRSLLIFSAVFVLFFLGMQLFGPKKPEPAAPAAPAAARKSNAAQPTSIAAPGSAAASGQSDATAMAAQVTRLLENPNLAAKLGERAGDDAATRYHPDTIAAKTASFHRAQIERWQSRSDQTFRKRQLVG